jgi:FtsZ-interacting cell division protein ZipA
MALAKAMEARRAAADIKKQQKEEIKAAKKAAKQPKVIPKEQYTAPAPVHPRPETPEPEESESESESEPERPMTPPKKTKAKPSAAPTKPAKPTKVYSDSSDSESSDDDNFVLVKKKLVKKYKALKGSKVAPHPYPHYEKPTVTHEISERALMDRWATDRYKHALSSLFPTQF